MRIAQFVPSLRATGPVNVAVDLARQLVKEGHDVHLFYFDDIVEHNNLDFPASLVDKHTVTELKQFDVVHSHCLRPDLFIYRNRHRLRTVRKVCTIHNIVHEDLRYSHTAIVTAIIARLWIHIWRATFDDLVVLSDASMKYYANYLKIELLHRVYNGRQLSESGNEECVTSRDLNCVIKKWRNDGKIVIGSCAVLSPIKGLEQIIKLLDLDDRLVYLIVGDGPSRYELESQVRTLNLSERVIFAGKQKNVQTFLKKMDLFAIPSRSEGLPLAALEAASYAKPILCSEIEIFREIFTEESAAFFMLDDLPALTQALNSMISRLSQMGERAKDQFLKSFTVKKMADSYLSIYFNGVQENIFATSQNNIR